MASALEGESTCTVYMYNNNIIVLAPTGPAHWPRSVQCSHSQCYQTPFLLVVCLEMRQHPHSCQENSDLLGH